MHGVLCTPTETLALEPQDRAPGCTPWPLCPIWGISALTWQPWRLLCAPCCTGLRLPQRPPEPAWLRPGRGPPPHLGRRGRSQRRCPPRSTAAIKLGAGQQGAEQSRARGGPAKPGEQSGLGSAAGPEPHFPRRTATPLAQVWELAEPAVCCQTRWPLVPTRLPTGR